MSLCAAQEQVTLRSLTPARGVRACEQGCVCVCVAYVHATQVARESRVGALLTFLPRLSAPVILLFLLLLLLHQKTVEVCEAWSSDGGVNLGCPYVFTLIIT